MRYGLIGNCKTAALISDEGSIDWCCMPNFDSPSVFGRILDPKAGKFRVEMATPCTIKQIYIPQTNILKTTFDDGVNAFELIDYMPRYKEGHDYTRPVEIHRILKPIKGRPQIKIVFHPRFNYARGKTTIELRHNAIRAAQGLESLYLYSNLPLDKILASEPMELRGDYFLLLTYFEKLVLPDFTSTYVTFTKTQHYWEQWALHCQLPKIKPDYVLRSALTLKLMAYEDTGAIIAAPTTSLPEILGEERNWDYRFCWLRDASLMLEALKRIGHFEEAKSFIHFLLKIFENKRTKVQIAYGIGGGIEAEEKILSHLKGYKGTGPVRIGNQAFGMQQNDIFGEILNALYLYYFHYNIEKISDEAWALVKFLVNTISRDWAKPDAGIWEFRQQESHFTFSKILSWVALDRGVKIAEKLNKKYALNNWTPIRDKIKNDVDKRGWNKKVNSFTQIYGSPDLDASLLLMERYQFIEKTDPRWIATVLACEKALVKNKVGFRYTSSDDFGKPKSAFIVATLWIAKALHSIGEKNRAMEIFDNILIHTNHLGLLSEDIDPKTGELLGNFPQAYSHMAVINTAVLMDG